MISKKANYMNIILKKIKMKKRSRKYILTSKRFVHFDEPPKSIAKKYLVTKDIINNMTCMTLEKNKQSKHHLFYYHGGAYSLDAAKSHWKLIDYILEHSDTKVSFINYPLYPESTCLNTIQKTLAAYKQLVDPTCEVTLAGDSSGGGLALSLAQLISTKVDIKQPEKLLLFSPWLDLTLNQDISQELMDNDLILTKETLVQAGINYAGDLDPTDPLCSPYFGDCTNIGKIALFTGTHDILNPQASHFNSELKNQDINIDFYEYNSMQHVWIIFPIPEATDALDKACDFIHM